MQLLLFDNDHSYLQRSNLVELLLLLEIPVQRNLKRSSVHLLDYEDRQIFWQLAKIERH
ncbi:hypothetical protein D3C73_928020 [compost metagenome]